MQESQSKDLKALFDALQVLLKRYEPPFTATVDQAGRYELWSKKPLVIAGRKRTEVFFASLVIRRDYVGFYYMPVYTEVELKKLISPALLKLLKGKSCFYIRVLTPELAADIERALALGLKRYQENGWV